MGIFSTSMSETNYILATSLYIHTFTCVHACAFMCLLVPISVLCVCGLPMHTK